MTAQIEPYYFDLFDPISIIGFVCSFKIVCDTKEIHDRAEMWLFHFFTKESASSALRMCLTSKHKARTKVTFSKRTTLPTTYLQVMSYWQRTYATNEKNADTENELTTFIKPPNETPSQYAVEPVAKTIRCGDVHEEQDLNKKYSSRD